MNSLAGPFVSPALLSGQVSLSFAVVDLGCSRQVFNTSLPITLCALSEVYRAFAARFHRLSLGQNSHSFCRLTCLFNNTFSAKREKVGFQSLCFLSISCANSPRQRARLDTEVKPEHSQPTVYWSSWFVLPDLSRATEHDCWTRC